MCVSDATLNGKASPDALVGLAIGGGSNFLVRDRITSGHLEAAHLGGYGVKTWGALYAARELACFTVRWAVPSRRSCRAPE